MKNSHTHSTSLTVSSLFVLFFTVVVPSKQARGGTGRSHPYKKVCGKDN